MTILKAIAAVVVGFVGAVAVQLGVDPSELLEAIVKALVAGVVSGGVVWAVPNRGDG